MPLKKTTESFIKDALKVHGNIYTYLKVKYVNSKQKVIITCKKHGDFLKSPNHFLKGQGCRVCSGKVKLTQESFLKRAKIKHGSLYDYSQINIKSKIAKVKIICKQHGEFFQLPSNHLKGQGCPLCGKISSSQNQRQSLTEFIKSVKKKHDNKYDYSKVNYKNSQTEVEILCPEHGQFFMKPNSHFNGQGCPVCGRQRAKEKVVLPFKTFLERARKLHGSKYEYIQEDYSNYTSKMEMVCKKHGSFFQTPHSHISMVSGCPKCGYIKAGSSNSITWETVLDLFKTAHGNRYKYDGAAFKNVTSKINIHCKKHGIFKQNVNLHYNGSGCPKCGIEDVHDRLKLDFNEFKARSIKIHGEKYDYSDSEYIDIHFPVKINCKKHGGFYQVPREHYRGSGCPLCNSSKGESAIRKILKSSRIKFKEQKQFKNLKNKSRLRCDFFLPELNTVIEYNGLQHYEPIAFFGGQEGFNETKKRDIIKYKFLKENDIKLIIIRFDCNNIEQELISQINLLSS